jgi:hypothetical protein
VICNLHHKTDENFINNDPKAHGYLAIKLLATTDKEKANIFDSQLVKTFKSHPLITLGNNFNVKIRNFLSAQLSILPVKPISQEKLNF